MILHKLFFERIKMKFFPEPGWRRSVSLAALTVLLTLLTATCLNAYLLVNEPQTILNINFELSFRYLKLTKKMILEKTVNGNKIYFYSDSFKGKPVEIVNEAYLYSVLKEAYDDFGDFVAQRHNLNKPPKKLGKKLKIMFVREEIYKTRDPACKAPTRSAAFAEIRLRNIFIEVKNEKNGKFDILKEKKLLRHEIFHILSGEHNFSELVPHQDAERFENLK